MAASQPSGKSCALAEDYNHKLKDAGERKLSGIGEVAVATMAHIIPHHFQDGEVEHTLLREPECASAFVTTASPDCGAAEGRWVGRGLELSGPAVFVYL
jgi:hypothetical protein